MNAQSPLNITEPKLWFNAAEIAALVVEFGIPSLPGTKRGVANVIAREKWDEQPATLARQREGSKGGGGMEYHVNLLPDVLRIKVLSRDVKSALLVQHNAEVAAGKRRMSAIRASGLSPRARRVMEARAEVLRSIEGYGYSQGQMRAWAIARFLEAQEHYLTRQDLNDRVGRGEILTESGVALLARPVLLTAEAGFALTPETVAIANNRSRGLMKIGRSALYDWFRLLDTDGEVALAPKPNREDQPIPEEFGRFLKHWAMPRKPSIPEAHAEYLKDCVDPATALTVSQVEYIISKKLDNIQRHIGREGILTLRSRLPYVSRSTEDMLPTTIYTADGKTFDAEVADPVSGRPMRPEITSVLDVATRKCVGFAVSRKENVIAVTEALRRSVETYGIPAIFYTDRGAGYKNKAFDGEATPDAAVGGLLARLHIAKMHALPYNSQAKGIIERFNAHWNRLAKSFPTYIGADMDKEAKQKAHKATRGEIKAFGHSRTLPSWDVFLDRVGMLVAEYNASPHSSLPKIEDAVTGRWRHMSPDEAWSAHVAAGWEPITIDKEEADDLFRPYEIRTVSRGLVLWNTNEYFHQALERYHGESVMVGYDLHQAKQVWVREYDPETLQPGRLICVAEFGGNRRDYAPRTRIQKAEEDRAKGALKRLDAKREAVLDELRAPLLDHQPMEPMPVWSEPVKLHVVEKEPVPESADMAAPSMPARRIIHNDIELAQVVIDNPEELTPGRARLLREALATNSGRDLMRLSGVDLAALDRVLWSAA